MKSAMLFGVVVSVLFLSFLAACPASARAATAGSAAYSSDANGGELWYGTGTGILGTTPGFGGRLHGGYDRASGGPGIPGLNSRGTHADMSPTSATGPSATRAGAPAASTGK